MNIHDIIDIIDGIDGHERANWRTTDIAGTREGLCRLLVPYLVAQGADADAVRAEPSDFFHLFDAAELQRQLSGNTTIVRGPFGCWYARQRPNTHQEAL